MPIPKPRNGESKDKFISRCMADSHMNSSFSDQEQRSAVCFAQWKKKNASKSIDRVIFNLESYIAKSNVEAKISVNKRIGVLQAIKKTVEDLIVFKVKALPIGSKKVHSDGKTYVKVSEDKWVVDTEAGKQKNNTSDADSGANKKDEDPRDKDLTPEQKKVLDGFKRKAPGEGVNKQIDTKEDLDLVLSHGNFAMISAGRNPNIPEDKDLTDDQINQRTQKMREQLISSGYVFTEGVGNYGGIEESFLVMVHDADDEELFNMGKEYNQDSVLFVDHGESKLVKTTGENAGNIIMEGSGHGYVPEADDYYTAISAGSENIKFSMNLSDVVGEIPYRFKNKKKEESSVKQE